jgi:hypothetical protein
MKNRPFQNKDFSAEAQQIDFISLCFVNHVQSIAL